MIILEKDEIQQASYSRIIHLLKDSPPSAADGKWIIDFARD